MTLLPFIQDFRLPDLPGETRERLGDCLKDILGVAAGAGATPAATALRAYAVEHYPASGPGARLLFDGRRVHPLGAAWAGGFCVDSLDAHEGHFLSKGHAGASVVPALLALADATHQQGLSLSGRDLLEAIALGYEVALRAGRALVLSSADYHASGAFSALGVVAGGARLLALDQTRLRHALGIAEYFAPRCPMMRLIDHPSMLRDAHGAGAHAGLNALLLARAGVTGTPALLVEAEEVAACWTDLGSRWEIDSQYFKPWPVCRWAQPALTAIEDLQACHDRRLVADEVERIRIDTFHESMRLQGRAPANADEAQYALAFPVAALICRGRLGPEEVSDEAVMATDIRALCQRIEIHECPELSAAFPERLLSRLVIEFRDGRRWHSEVTSARGDPERPMSRAQLDDKFAELVAGSLGEPRCEVLARHLRELEEAATCAGLFDAVTAPRHP